MTITLLQIDFPFAGPWGEDAAQAMRGLAEDIAAEPGLRWKVWTENRVEGRAGGIYAFEDAESARCYLRKHTARLAGFGITEPRCVEFGVNAGLSSITRAPVAN